MPEIITAINRTMKAPQKSPNLNVVQGDCCLPKIFLKYCIFMRGGNNFSKFYLEVALLTVSSLYGDLPLPNFL